MENILRELNGKQFGEKYCFTRNNEKFVATLDYDSVVDYGWRNLIKVTHVNNSCSNVFKFQQGAFRDGKVKYYDNELDKFVVITDFSSLIQEIIEWIDFMTTESEFKNEKERVNQVNSMNTNKETLFNVVTTIYDCLQYAKENLSHATDSHETSSAEGQCEMMETLVENVYNLIKETEDGDSIIKKLHSYEENKKEFVKKAEVIIEASDYELSLGFEEDECIIDTIIEQLEKDGIEVKMENFDKIVEYVENEINN